MAAEGRSAANTVNVSEGRFDYNAEVLVETSQETGRDLWHRLDGCSTNQLGPWYVEIPVTTGKEYLDLNSSTIELTLKVTRRDGTNLNSWRDMVAPVNMLGAVLWKEVEVTFNNAPMPSASAVHCGLKHYMEAILTHDKDSAFTHLKSQLCEMDTPGQFNNFEVSARQVRENFVAAMKRGEVAVPAVPIDPGYNPNAGGTHDPDEFDAIMEDPISNEMVAAAQVDAVKRRLQRERFYQGFFKEQVADVLALLRATGRRQPNRGYEKRMRWVRGSDLVNLSAPVPHDFFNLDNMLSPGSRVLLKLTRYSDEFLLNTYFAEEQYKIVLVDAKLRYRTVVRDGPVPSIEHYQMNQTELRTQIVEVNSNMVDFKIHTNGVMPKTVIVGMVDTNALNGNYAYNPFFFDHFLVKRMKLTVNGRDIPEYNGLEFDFNRPGRNPIMANAYRWLFDNTGALESDRANLIGWDGFAHGSFLVPWDLTPDRCNGAHHHQCELGYIKLTAEFARPLAQPIYIVYKMIFPKIITVNKARGSVEISDVHKR